MNRIYFCICITFIHSVSVKIKLFPDSISHFSSAFGDKQAKCSSNADLRTLFNHSKSTEINIIAHRILRSNSIFYGTWPECLCIAYSSSATAKYTINGFRFCRRFSKNNTWLNCQEHFCFLKSCYEDIEITFVDIGDLGFLLTKNAIQCVIFQNSNVMQYRITRSVISFFFMFNFTVNRWHQNTFRPCMSNDNNITTTNHKINPAVVRRFLLFENCRPNKKLCLIICIDSIQWSCLPICFRRWKVFDFVGMPWTIWMPPNIGTRLPKWLVSIQNFDNKQRIISIFMWPEYRMSRNGREKLCPAFNQLVFFTLEIISVPFVHG